MTRTAAALIIIFIFLPGCSDVMEKTQVRNAIQRYNELLVRGYNELNMNPLAEVATPDLAAKSYYHMAAVGEGGLRIESALKKLDFIKIDLQNKGQSALVETREIWDFAQRDMKTGKTYYEEIDFVYDMGYELHKNGDKWIITSVNTIRSSSRNNPVRPPESKGKGRPDAQAGKK
jgi:hypothetical protein